MVANSIKNLLFFICCLHVNECPSSKTFKSSNKEIRIKKNHCFSYVIPANLSSGYQWVMFDTSSFKIITHTSKPNKNADESADLEVFKLKPLKRGKSFLKFYYIRVFDKTHDTLNTKKIFQKIKVK